MTNLPAAQCCAHAAQQLQPQWQVPKPPSALASPRLVANQLTTHTPGRAASSLPFSLQLEIIPKALGSPKKLVALVYTGNHPNSFKSECLYEWSEPSTLFLQPEVAGTSPEGGRTAGETLAVP